MGTLKKMCKVFLQSTISKQVDLQMHLLTEAHHIQNSAYSSLTHNVLFSLFNTKYHTKQLSLTVFQTPVKV